jgi:uncharacterized damage-inducible protein DinB
MRTIEDFLSHFRRQRSWTRRLVAAIPEERFSWSPSSAGIEAFGFGELVRHLIQSEIFWSRMFVEAAAGRVYDPFELSGGATERMTAFRPRNLQSSRSPKFGSTFAECLESWSQVQARTEEELSRFTPEQLQTVVVDHPLIRMRAPLWEMLLTMVDHEVHHRGQLSGYLKTLGIAQPPFLGEAQPPFLGENPETETPAP